MLTHNEKQHSKKLHSGKIIGKSIKNDLVSGNEGFTVKDIEIKNEEYGKGAVISFYKIRKAKEGKTKTNLRLTQRTLLIDPAQVKRNQKQIGAFSEFIS